jgi:SAM-dependent methyltransferase
VLLIDVPMARPGTGRGREPSRSVYRSTMSFRVGAEAYDRFMGRYSEPLAPHLADLARVAAGQHVLDVGCGPGALTAELVRRVGAPAVAAVEPSEPFVAAARARHPGVDVRHAAAEELPFADGTFDAALAQLVVHFMTDPVAGLGEMRRVTRSDGVVVACVWDHQGGRGPLGVFWDAVRRHDRDVAGEADLAGAREGHLGELLRAAGLRQVEETSLAVRVVHPSFEDWWEPVTLGVGPAGAYVAGLDTDARARLRAECLARQPSAPFVVTALAWAARGVV